ncbi:MAG: 2 protein [Candidatus Poribacteria bacterium]|nr:2 protein [Candidatus Poribacteria bacterium]
MIIKSLRLLFFFIGLLLFVLVLPHTDPWHPTNIETSGSIFQNVTVKFPIIHRSTTLSGGYVFLFALFLLILLAIASSSARKNIINLIRSPRQLVSIIIPLALFVFTLYPTIDGLPIVIYLTLSGIGLLFMLFGLYPILAWLVRKIPQVSVIWKKICNAFYNLRPSYFMILAFAIPFIITNICSYFIFGHVPHVQDNIDQVFHAKIFLNGHLTVLSHQYKEFFDFTHNINNGKWYSEYPPGHTFILMLGLLVGAPWIINPLLGSLSIVLFYLIGREIFDEKIGRLSALLGILSPFIIFMSSEFFSHATALFCISLFALFFVKTVNSKFKFYYPLIAGVSLGVCLNARPFTAIGIVIPYIIYASYLLIRHTKIYLSRFTIMIVSFALFVGILLGFNYLTNGNPFLFAYEVLHGKQHNPGFGHSAWGPPHTPLKGLIQDLNDLNALNKYLFEWCIPSTFFVLLFFMGKRQNKWDYLLISSVFSLPFVYFFYWYQGWCFGPRFAYESTLPLILLTARGIIHTPEIMQDRFNCKNVSMQRLYVNLTIIFCVIIAMSVNVPVLVKQYSNSSWGVNTDVQRAVRREKISNAVVFVGSYYGSVLAENSPLLDSSIIYVRDLGVKNKQMMKYYPDRRYYLANGGDIQEIFIYYYDDMGNPITPNSDFEKGTLEGWSVNGKAWGVTDRQRDNRSGGFHAESLVGGEEAIGVIKSGNFKITGNAIRFFKNGWNRDPIRPNQYFLKDVMTNATLRTTSPPNQDGFVTQFWDVSDLIGREVYFMIADNDDDTLKKGGYAWLGIDNITIGDIKYPIQTH